MALEHSQPSLSFAEYLLLPDEPRGEVLDGVFTVTPAPNARHQELAGEIFFEIKRWLREHPDAGAVFIAPLDVVLRAERPAVVVQPDILYVAAARQAIVQDAVLGAPDLAVEVVSPSSAGRDAVTKRELYARHGVRELWLVWPQERRVDVLVADQSGVFGEARTLLPAEVLTSDVLPGFTLAVADLFGPEPGP